MVENTDNKPDGSLSLTGEAAIIRQLEQSIKGGQHWYLALLDAIGKWSAAEETISEQRYQYLIGGEAFDWLLLAERLCSAVKNLIPETEMSALLFYGEPPLELPAGRFKEIIGEIKHHQYLNFFYGVTAEEALILAVEEEVRKERWASGYHHDKDNTSEAFRRIYGATKSVMLRRFRRERSYPLLKSITLSELKEFTYWLFKRRLKESDKAKVASDTKKALDWIKGRVFSKWLGKRAFGLEDSAGPLP